MVSWDLHIPASSIPQVMYSDHGDDGFSILLLPDRLLIKPGIAIFSCPEQLYFLKIVVKIFQLLSELK